MTDKTSGSNTSATNISDQSPKVNERAVIRDSRGDTSSLLSYQAGAGRTWAKASAGQELQISDADSNGFDFIIIRGTKGFDQDFSNGGGDKFQLALGHGVEGVKVQFLESGWRGHTELRLTRAGGGAFSKEEVSKLLGAVEFSADGALGAASREIAMFVRDTGDGAGNKKVWSKPLKVQVEEAVADDTLGYNERGVVETASGDVAVSVDYATGAERTWAKASAGQELQISDADSNGFDFIIIRGTKGFDQDFSNGGGDKFQLALGHGVEGVKVQFLESGWRGHTELRLTRAGGGAFSKEEVSKLLGAVEFSADGALGAASREIAMFVRDTGDGAGNKKVWSKPLKVQVEEAVADDTLGYNERGVVETASGDVAVSVDYATGAERTWAKASAGQELQISDADSNGFDFIIIRGTKGFDQDFSNGGGDKFQLALGHGVEGVKVQFLESGWRGHTELRLTRAGGGAFSKEEVSKLLGAVEFSADGALGAASREIAMFVRDTGDGAGNKKVWSKPLKVQVEEAVADDTLGYNERGVVETASGDVAVSVDYATGAERTWAKASAGQELQISDADSNGFDFIIIRGTKGFDQDFSNGGGDKFQLALGHGVEGVKVQFLESGWRGHTELRLTRAGGGAFSKEEVSKLLGAVEFSADGAIGAASREIAMYVRDTGDGAGNKKVWSKPLKVTVSEPVSDDTLGYNERGVVETASGDVAVSVDYATGAERTWTKASAGQELQISDADSNGFDFIIIRGTKGFDQDFSNGGGDKFQLALGHGVEGVKVQFLESGWRGHTELRLTRAGGGAFSKEEVSKLLGAVEFSADGAIGAASREIAMYVRDTGDGAGNKKVWSKPLKVQVEEAVADDTLGYNERGVVETASGDVAVSVDYATGAERTWAKASAGQELQISDADSNGFDFIIIRGTKGFDQDFSNGGGDKFQLALGHGVEGVKVQFLESGWRGHTELRLTRAGGGAFSKEEVSKLLGAVEFSADGALGAANREIAMFVRDTGDGAGNKALWSKPLKVKLAGLVETSEMMAKSAPEIKTGVSGENPAVKGSADKGSADKGSADKGSADKGSADKGSADKGSADKGSADKGSADKGSADKGSADKGSADKGSADKGSADKGSADKGSADKGSADKGSADKGSADKGSADKGSADKGSADKGSADKGSADKGSADKGSADKGSADKGSADKGSADKGSADKGSADKGSADKGSADSEIGQAALITEVVQNIEGGNTQSGEPVDSVLQAALELLESAPAGAGLVSDPLTNVSNPLDSLLDPISSIAEPIDSSVGNLTSTLGVATEAAVESNNLVAGGLGTSGTTDEPTPVQANQVPTAQNADLGSTEEDVAFEITAASLLANSSDADGDSLSVASVQLADADQGTISVTEGGWTYSPAENFNGDNVEFTFTVSDGKSTSEASATLDVTAVNDVSVVDSVHVGLTETDVALTTSGTLEISDVDNSDPLFQEGTISGALGELSIEATGEWTFSAYSAFNNFSAGHQACENFTVRGQDGSIGSVKITINGTDDAASVTSESVALTETDVALITGGKLFAEDPDGPDNKFEPTSKTGSTGEFNLDASGNWTFNAHSALDNLSAGQQVNETFAVRSIDGTPSKVSVTITGTNDAAIVSSESVQLEETDAVLTASGKLISQDVDNDDNSFQAITKNGGLGVFNIDGEGNWTFQAHDALDGMGAGEIRNETFDVASIDGTPSQVTVTITGTNDAAIVGSQSVQLEESDVVLTASGKLTSQDVDNDDNSFQASSKNGGLGVFNIDGEGNWTFQAHDALDGMGAGEIRNETFDVASIDGTPSHVTVTITGTNDAAIVGSQSVQLEESDVVLTASGKLTSQDVDNDDNSFQAITKNGGLGVFNIDGEGNWTFQAHDALDGMGAGEIRNETFDIASIDGTPSQVTVTITGTNDAAIVSSQSVQLEESDVVLTASGKLTSQDVDNADNSFAAGTIDGTYGILTVSENGAWAFTANSAFDSLSAGDQRSETYTVRTIDGTPSTVDITINGTNDAAIVSSASVSLNESDAVLSTSGTLSSQDVDNADNRFQADTITGQLGQFGIDVDGNWDFTANKAFDELNAGDQLTEIYTVRSEDGTPGTVEIVINGTNDAANISDTGSVSASCSVVSSIGSSLVLSETDQAIQSSGSLTVTDLDEGESGFIVKTTNGQIGDFTIDAEGNWNFTAKSAHDSLNVGDQLSETYTVRSIDGTQSTVDITITGTNDAASVSSAIVGLVEGDVALTANGRLYSQDVDNADNSFQAGNIPGTYGNLLINADGAWTFTANSAFDELNVGDARSESFTVRSIDGTPGTVEISINGTNDAAMVSSASVSLVETDAVLQTSGRLTSQDADNPDDCFIVETLPGQWGALQIDAGGNWTYTTNKAFDELNAGDVRSETFTVSSIDGTQSTVEIALNGSNDAPVLNSSLTTSAVYELQSAGAQGAASCDTNLLLVLDVSGSMGRSSGVGGSRLDVLKTSVSKLIDQYEASGNVSVKVVTFTDIATVHGSQWQDGTSSKAQVSSLHNGGWTNFDSAMGLVMDTTWNQSGKIIGAQNVSYFMSDGESQSSIDSGEEATWKSFLEANDIRSFALGMGNGTKPGELNKIAYDGFGESDTNSIVVTDFAQLESTLNKVAADQIQEAAGAVIDNTLTIADVDNNTLQSATVEVTTGFTAGDLLMFQSHGNIQGSYNDQSGVLTLTGNASLADYQATLRSVSFGGEGAKTSQADRVIEFTVNDGHLDSNLATATVDVEWTNTAPEAEDVDLGATLEDTGFTIHSADLLDQAKDIDGDDLSISRVDLVDNNLGALQDNNNGTWTFTPTQNWNGQDVAFMFTVTDGMLTDDATATLDVVAVNDLPSVDDVDLGSMQEDGVRQITAQELLNKSTDVDGDALNIDQVTLLSAGGSLAANGNDTWTFTPNQDFNGQNLEFSFTVNDGGGQVNGTALLDVDAVNDAPVLSSSQSEQPVVTLAEATNLTFTPGQEFRVNTSTELAQQAPDVAALPNGGFVVTWQGGLIGDECGIGAQLYGEDGQPVGGEFLVNTHTLFAQTDPSVAVLENGDFVVTWTSLVSPGDWSGHGISGQLFNADGEPQGQEFLVNSNTYSGQAYPSTIALKDGGFVVTWTSFDGATGDESSSGIAGQRFNVDGVPVGGEFLVNSGTNSAQASPSLASLKDGGFVVTWSSDDSSTGDRSGSGIAGQRFDVNGDPLGDEFIVNSNRSGGQYGPSTTALEDGGFLVTWTSDDSSLGDNSGSGIAGQRFNASSEPVGQEFLINSNTGSGQFDPSATPLADGGFLVTWTSYDAIGDTSGYGIAGQRFNSAGEKVGEEFTINSSIRGDQRKSSVTALADGSFVVSWATGTSKEVHARMFSASGSGVESGSELIDPTLTISDVDSSILEGATISIAEGYEQGDSLTFTALGNIQGSFDSNSGVLTLSGQASLADYQATLRSVALECAGSKSADDRIIEFKVTDGQLESNLASTTVAVELANEAPDAQDVDLGATDEDIAKLITTADLLDNSKDADGDALTVEKLELADGSMGSLVSNGNGTWTFRPTKDWNGEDVEFKFTVSDGELSDDALATLDVTAVNDAPNAQRIDLGAMVEEGQKTIDSADLLKGATDVDGDSLTINSVSLTDSNAGMLVDNLNGSWTFTAAKDYNANDVTFGYTLSDGTTSHSNNAVIDILPENDAPVLSSSLSSNAVLTLAEATDLTFTPGKEFRVNTSTATAQQAPDVAALANGGFVVTWEGCLTGDGYGIGAQLYSADGTPVGGEFLINSHKDSTQSEASVTSLKDGGFVVTWSSNDSATGDTSFTGISGQRFDANGNEVGGEFRVNSNTLRMQEEPSVTSLDDGGFVVTWTSWDSATGDTDWSGISGQRFDADGNELGGEFRVNSKTSSIQHESTVTSLEGGGFLVTWSSEDGEDSATDSLYPIHDWNISGQRFDANGNEVGGEFRVNTNTYSDQYHSSVTILQDGGFVVTWTSGDSAAGDTSGYGISGQRFDANGNEVGGEFLVNSNTSRAQYSPSVTSLNDGGFVVTWSGMDSATGDTSGSGISGQRFDVDGKKVGDEFLVNSVTSGEQHQPSITSLNDGSFVVSWTTGTGAETEVQARMFSASGSGVESGSELVDATLTISDVDNNTLQSATAEITTGFTAGDKLTFKAQGNIQGSYDDQSGVLALTGNASVADYQATLRSVSFGGEGAKNSQADRMIEFTVNDGQLESKVSPALVEIDWSNEAPVATHVDLGSVVEDQRFTLRAAAILAATKDSDGDVLTLLTLELADPSTGVLSKDGKDTWVFTPTKNWSGNDVLFKYVVSDGVLTDESTASIDVVAVNDAPSVSSVDLGATLEDVARIISVEELLAGSQDVDGDKLEVTTVTLGRSGIGVLQDLGNETWSFTPTKDYYGTNVPLNFTVSDGQESRGGTAYIDITPVNDAPIIRVSAADPIVAPPSYGGGSEYGESHHVRELISYQPANGTRAESTVTALDGGQFLVTWDSYDAFSGLHGLEGQVYSASGDAVGNGFFLPASEASQSQPTIISSNDGGFKIVSQVQGSPAWQPYASFDAADTNIEWVAQHFSSDGEVLGEHSFGGRDSVQNSTLTPLPDGGYVIVWEEQNPIQFAPYYEAFDPFNSGQGMYHDAATLVAQRFTSDGYEMGSTFIAPIGGATLGSEGHAVVASLANGGYVVAWEVMNSHHGLVETNFQAFDVQGHEFGYQWSLSIGASVENLSIVGLADGGFVASWEESGASQYLSHYDLYTGTDPYYSGNAPTTLVVQSFTSDGYDSGNTLREPIGGATPGSSEPAVVTSLVDGGFVVAWEVESAWTGGAETKIRVFDEFGFFLGNEVVLGPMGESVENLSIVSTADGGFMAAWEEIGGGQHYSASDPLLDPLAGLNGSLLDPLAGLNDPVIDPLAGFNNYSGYDLVTSRNVEVVVQQFSSLGERVGSEVRYDPGSSSADSSLVTLEDGRVMLTWMSTQDDLNHLVVMNSTIVHQDASRIVVDSTLSISDQDSEPASTLLEGAMVTIAEGYQQGDVLEFVPVGNIQGYFDDLSGLLTLTGAANVFEYEAALQSVTFRAASPEAQGNRVIEFQVNDGATLSAPARVSLHMVENHIEGYEWGGHVGGSTEADWLQGNAGDDSLYGYQGDDILDAGAGFNVITGGEGADHFVFRITPDHANDRVTDFSVEQGDVLDIRDLLPEGVDGTDPETLDKYLHFNRDEYGNSVMILGENMQGANHPDPYTPPVIKHTVTLEGVDLTAGDPSATDVEIIGELLSGGHLLVEH